MGLYRVEGEALDGSNTQHERRNEMTNNISNEKALNPTVGATATSAGRYLGYTVSWDFGDDFAMLRSEAHRAFEDHGFGEFIERDDRDLATALLTAPRTGGGRWLRVEVLEKPDKDTPAAIGIYRKRRGDEKNGDEFEYGARVRVDQSTGSIIATRPEGQHHADDDCLKLAQRIAKDANLIVNHCFVKEVSQALCRVGRACLWANYRDNGGTWFVYDGHRAEKFRKLLIAIKKLSQKGFTEKGRPNYTFRPRVQPLNLVGNAELDELTETNITESSEATLEGELQKLMKDLEKVQKDGMRASSIERRIDGCDDLISRANLYRTILKEAADEINERIEEVKAAFEKELQEDAKVATQVDAVFSNIDKLVGKPKAKKRRRRAKKARVKKDSALTEDELFSV